MSQRSPKAKLHLGNTHQELVVSAPGPPWKFLTHTLSCLGAEEHHTGADCPVWESSVSSRFPLTSRPLHEWLCGASQPEQSCSALCRQPLCLPQEPSSNTALTPCPAPVVLSLVFQTRRTKLSPSTWPQSLHHGSPGGASTLPPAVAVPMETAPFPGRQSHSSSLASSALLP